MHWKLLTEKTKNRKSRKNRSTLTEKAALAFFIEKTCYKTMEKREKKHKEDLIMKKKLVGILLIVSMTVLGLSGCGGAGAQTEEETADTTAVSTETGEIQKNADVISEVTADASAKIADEITYARAADVTCLDPVLVSYTADIQIVNMICEELVTTNDDGTEIVPGLAESWDVSEDGLVYTFHIIPGLKFSDGSAVTAEDWKFSFDRAMTTAESSWAFAVENIASVETPNDDTVVITQKEATANLLSNLSCFNVALQSKAHYDATNGYTDAGSYPIGTGSYCVSDWVTDDHITLTANPNYHGDAPKTATIKFLTVPDDNSRMMMLKSKEVDVISDIPYSNMEELNSTDGIIAAGLESTGNKYIIFNETSNEALANKEVRQALLYATDKQQIVDMVLNGYGEPAVSFLPMNGLYWNDEITPVEYDVDKAKDLLSDAGYADGFDLEVLVPSGNDTYAQIATILKDMWAQIGVNLTITSLDQAAVYDQEYAMKHQMLFGSWSDDIADPSQLGSYWWDYDASQCFFTGYQNEDAQKIFEQSQYELDDSAREDLYFQLQKIFYDDVVAINMYHADATVALSDSIQGYVQTPLYSYRFDKLIKVEE